MAFTTPFEASQSEDQVTSSICYMFVVIIGKHSVNQFFRLWNSIEIIGVLRFKNNSKILLTDIFDLRHDYRQVWLSVELRSSTGEVIFWNCFFLNYSIKKSKFFHILHVVNNSNQSFHHGFDSFFFTGNSYKCAMDWKNFQMIYKLSFKWTTLRLWK